MLDKASYLRGVTGLPWDVQSCCSKLQNAPLTGPLSKSCPILPLVDLCNKKAASSGMEIRLWMTELAKQVFLTLTKPTKSCKMA